MRSWCNELFESEEIKTLFGGFALFLGASPDDAGSAHHAWLFASVLQDVGNNLVKGGMQNLSLALARFLQSKGGSIRTGARVDRILAHSGRATGVRLQDGEVVTAGMVVSAVDPATLVLKLLGEDAVGPEIVKLKGQSIKCVRISSAETSLLRLLLSGLPALSTALAEIAADFGLPLLLVRELSRIDARGSQKSLLVQVCG